MVRICFGPFQNAFLPSLFIFQVLGNAKGVVAVVVSVSIFRNPISRNEANEKNKVEIYTNGHYCISFICKSSIEGYYTFSDSKCLSQKNFICSKGYKFLVILNIAKIRKALAQSNVRGRL